MKWNAYLVASRPASDAAKVHIIERRYLEPLTTVGRYSSIKTCCGIELTASFIEYSQEDTNCEICIAKVEKQQAYWEQFWTGWAEKRIIKILTGMDKVEAEWREIHRETEVFLR